MSHTVPKEVRISTADKRKYFDIADAGALRFTDVALYSTTPHDQARYTVDIMRCYGALDDKTITDGSACIGGNTWAFARAARHVNAIEIDPLHAEILTHNLRVMSATNVTVVNRNYLDVLRDTVQDIIFLDPPWGGVNYRDEVDLTYKKDDTTVSLDELFAPLSYRCELLMLKVPMNVQPHVVDTAKKSNFLYYDEITITTPQDRPIYRIIILSHVKRAKEFPVKKFPKLGYKAIRVQAM